MPVPERGSYYCPSFPLTTTHSLSSKEHKQLFCTSSFLLAPAQGSEGFLTPSLAEGWTQQCQSKRGPAGFTITARTTRATHEQVTSKPLACQGYSVEENEKALGTEDRTSNISLSKHWSQCKQVIAQHEQHAKRSHTPLPLTAPQLLQTDRPETNTFPTPSKCLG